MCFNFISYKLQYTTNRFFETTYVKYQYGFNIWPGQTGFYSTRKIHHRFFDIINKYIIIKPSLESITDE